MLSLTFIQKAAPEAPAIPTEGEYVAVKCNKYKDRLLIGKVIELKSNAFILEWLQGRYTSQWRPWTGREKGKTVKYTDVIEYKNIVYRNIEFSGMKLQKCTVTALKAVYTL